MANKEIEAIFVKAKTKLKFKIRAAKEKKTFDALLNSLLKIK